MPLNDRNIITIIKTNKTMMNLEKLGLSSGDLLQRSQLATITGGETGGTGTCGYEDPEGYAVCNISKAQALSYYNEYDGRWCCDSCWKTDYCGDSPT